MAWHTHGLPGHFALLTSARPEEVQQATVRILHMWQVWRAASERQEPQVKAYCKRSFFNWPVVAELCQALEGLHPDRPDDAANMVSRIRRIFSSPGTNVVENQFKAGRRVETRDQDNCLVSNARKWWAPIDQAVLTRVYGFTEVPWQREVLTEKDVKKLPRDAFHAPTTASDTSMPFRSVVGTGEAAWPSPSPAGHKALQAELAALAYCHQWGVWNTLHKHWLCALASRGMLVRHRSEDRWFFSLGPTIGDGLSTSTVV